VNVLSEPGDIPDLSPGDHVCWLLDDPAAYTVIAAALLAEGVRLGQRPIVFGPEGSASLEDLASMAAIAVDPRAFFLGGRTVNPVAMLEVFREQTALARAEGYDGLRVVADMDGLLPKPPTTAGTVCFELRLDRLAREFNMTIVCAYRRSSFDTAAINGALSVHPAQIGSDGPPQFRFVAAEPGTWKLSGEVDLAVRVAFEAALTTAVSLGDCVVDVTALEFLDIAGMRAVAHVARDAEARVQLLGASSALRRFWELGGLGEFAPKVQLGP
jgi:ABC-type transporter Mla MlaB component